MFKLLNSK